jgi:hypothetical protein
VADDRPDDKTPKSDREGQGQRGQSQGRHGGRHRGFRGRHSGKPEGQRPEGEAQGADREAAHEGAAQRGRAEPEREMPICPICSKPVYDLSTALAANREQGDPAHFDCVLERVTDSESIGPSERLVYLGSGCFGVVEQKDKGEGSFLVKRRIQWEKEGEKKEWRKGLSSRIANL